MRTTMGKCLPTAMLVLLIVVTILAIAESRPQEDGLTSQADSELIKMITRLTAKQEKVSEGFSEKELDKMLSSLVKKHYVEMPESQCLDDAICVGVITANPRLCDTYPYWSNLCPRICNRCTAESQCVEDARCVDAIALLPNICDYPKLSTSCPKSCDMCKTAPSQWASWGPWSSCSATCGEGSRSRSRSCSDGGQGCVGRNDETDTCNNGACAAPPSDCVDKSPRCASLHSSCTYEFIKAICQATCNACTTTVAPPADPTKTPINAGCGMRPLLDDNGKTELKREIGVEKRIAGGYIAQENTWPFICYFGPLGCGGTLIKNRQGIFYFITAAHCTDDRIRIGGYTATCGIHSKEQRFGKGEKGGQHLKFSHYENHPDYHIQMNRNHLSEFANDIAIFTFAVQPVESEFVKPACLPTIKHFPGETLIAVGWGNTDEGPKDSLRQVRLQAVIDSTCQRYASIFTKEQFMCVTNLGGAGVGATCKGDSGGPVFAYRDGRWVLTGIVSFGSPICDRKERHSYLTDVHDYLPWIDDRIGGI